MTGFPSTPSLPIVLDLAGHTYAFRRLTWREEVAFTQTHPGGSRQVYVATAMTSVDGRAVTFTQSDSLLKALPRSVLDRVIVFYYGSLPDRRTPTVETPYVAPEPLEYVREVASAVEAQEDLEREALDRTFGAEDVDESLALGRQMVEAARGAGVGPASAPTRVPDEFQVEAW